MNSGNTFLGLSTNGTLTLDNGSVINTWYDAEGDRHVFINAPYLIANSRVQIYNATDNVELDNSVVGISGYSFETIWTADKTIRMRVSYQNGITAKTPLEAIGILSETGLLFINTQSNSLVYNAWGIDGSLQTQYSADGPNIDIDINVAGSYTKKSIASWWMYYITTSDGIRNFWGTYALEAENSIRQDVSVLNVLLQNTVNGTTVIFNDNDVRYYRSDYSIPYDVAPGYGSVFMDYSGVPLVPNPTIIETPTSGLTPSESATLEKINNLTENSGSIRFTSKALETAISSSLTQQQVRNAMYLSANSGSMVTGSIDYQLNQIKSSVDNFAIQGTISNYSVDAVTLTAGTATGTIANLVSRDGTYYTIAENNSTGIDLVVTKTTSNITEKPSVARITGYYHGGGSHIIYIQLWDYIQSSWITTANMYARTTDFDYVIPMSTNNHNLSTGEMKIRFLHNVVNYSTNDDLYLDYISFEKVKTNSSLGSDIARILVNQEMQMAADIIIQGTCAGVPNGSTNQIILASNASSIDGTYDPSLITITSGTGYGQCAIILQYKGSTRTATVNRDWKTIPDTTSVYSITPYAAIGEVNEGLLQGATLNTATLNANASDVDGTYIGQLVFLVSGTGSDQTNIVTSYVGSTRTATMDKNWSPIPDSNTGYVILPASPVLLANVQMSTINSIKSKTDTIPASPASVSDIPTVVQIRTEMDISSSKLSNLDATISSRASQLSVNSIPLNPLLTNDLRLNNLDVTVSSRLSTVGYTAPDNADILLIKAKTDNLPLAPAAVSNIPTVTQIRTEMDANSTKLSNLDTTISSRASQTTVNNIPTNPVLTTDLRLNSLDATISSRLSTAGYTTPPTAVAIRTELDTNSTKLVHLDADISSRMISSSFAIPPTVSEIRIEMDSNSTKLTNLDVPVSSRLSSASYVAPDNVDILLIKAKTDNLPANTATTLSGISTEISNLSSQESGHYDNIILASDNIYLLVDDTKTSVGNLSSQESSHYNAITSSIDSIPTVSQIRTEMDNNSTKLINLDVPISSRLESSSYVSPDNTTILAIKSKTDNLPSDPASQTGIINSIPTVVQIRTELDSNSSKLAYLDAQISSRMATFTYTAPPTVSEIRTDLDANSTKLSKLDTTISSRATQISVDSIPTNPLLSNDTRLNNIDARISSRLSADSYIAPNNSDIIAIRAKTDNLPIFPASVNDIPTPSQISAQIRVDLDSKLALIDEKISSRASQVTANAIKKNTNLIPATL